MSIPCSICNGKKKVMTQLPAEDCDKCAGSGVFVQVHSKICLRCNSTKPCPTCRGTNIRRLDTKAGAQFMCMADGCGKATAVHPTRELALAEWNGVEVGHVLVHSKVNGKVRAIRVQCKNCAGAGKVVTGADSIPCRACGGAQKVSRRAVQPCPRCAVQHERKASSTPPPTPVQHTLLDTHPGAFAALDALELAKV